MILFWSQLWSVLFLSRNIFHLSYCWYFRNPAWKPVEVGSLYHYLPGLIHPRWWSLDFWTINSISPWTLGPPTPEGLLYTSGNDGHKSPEHLHVLDEPLCTLPEVKENLYMKLLAMFSQHLPQHKFIYKKNDRSVFFPLNFFWGTEKYISKWLKATQRRRTGDDLLKTHTAFHRCVRSWFRQ